MLLSTIRLSTKIKQTIAVLFIILIVVQGVVSSANGNRLPIVVPNGDFIHQSEDYHTHYYSGQLYLPQQQQLYQQLEQQIRQEHKTNTDIVQLNTPLMLTANQTQAEMQQQIVFILRPALDAFLVDHPELFWLKGDGELANLTIFEEGAQVQLIAFSVVFEPIEYVFEEDYHKVNQQLNRLFANIIAEPDITRQLYALHQLLASSITYHTTFPPLIRSYHINGALVDGSAVCEGYAKVFQLLAERLGVRTILLGGFGVINSHVELHMWNAVELDGLWYAVDVTWDRQGGNIVDDYFLSGLYTLAPNFGNSMFLQTHIPHLRFSNTSYPLFQQPLFSFSDYKGSER